MKITLLTNYDAASSLALQYLLPELGKHHVTVFYTRKPAPLNPVPQALKELAQFEGSLTGLDEPFNATNAEPLNNINQPEAMQRFAQSAPELVISIRHMSILTPPAIAVPKYGVINLHSGLLPHYRGVMATFWAMQHQATHIGTTLHTIDDASIDTGRVIAQTRTAVDYQQSYWWNTLNVYQAGCASIAAAVNRLTVNAELTTQPQTGHGQYFTFPAQTDIDAAPFQLFDQRNGLSDFTT